MLAASHFRGESPSAPSDGLGPNDLAFWSDRDENVAACSNASHRDMTTLQVWTESDATITGVETGPTEHSAADALGRGRTRVVFPITVAGRRVLGGRFGGS